MRQKTSILVLVCVAAIATAIACSDSGRRNGNNTNKDGGTSTNPGGCAGLACFQMDCGGGTPTTLTGTVHAPNGIDPVYHAAVYVPNTLPEFPMTVQCEACNEPIGGTPVVTTTTDVDGTFTLTNVPATTQVPIVVQKGRFRRVFNVDVQGCTVTPLPDTQTRLPKNQQEGDLPKMAVGIGNYDQIECVLRSIGIDESEFTAPTGPGAVHLYRNSEDFGGGGGGGNDLSQLLTDYDKMATYNLLFVNCTGERAQNQPSGWKQNLFQYVNSGGRLYVTDWAYDYMEQIPEFAPYVFFQGAGNETQPQPPETAFYAHSGSDLKGTLVDDTLKQWMKAAGASTDGTLNIIGSWALANHVSANPDYATHVWVEGTAGGMKRPFTATFDYNMCGKVLWSSYHTQEPGGGGFDTSPTGGFPTYCKSTPTTMIPQEKVLEFLIFHISDCVQPVM